VLVHCGILSSDYLTYRIYEKGLFVGETISPMIYLLTSYRGQVCQWQKACTFVALYWADCNLYRLRHLFFNHWITEFFPFFVFVFFSLFSWLSWRWLDLYVVNIIHDFSELWCTMLGLICESVGFVSWPTTRMLSVKLLVKIWIDAILMHADGLHL
jgi:hypothetical protein